MNVGRMGMLRLGFTASKSQDIQDSCVNFGKSLPRQSKKFHTLFRQFKNNVLSKLKIHTLSRLFMIDVLSKLKLHTLSRHFRNNVLSK